MGLALCVGMLSDLKKNDEEGFKEFNKSFQALNNLLHENGLPSHNEPLGVEPWAAEMFGYSGLHYLRRLAAYVDCSKELPMPGDDDSSEDEILGAYFNHASSMMPGFLKSIFRVQNKFHREFDHLILHSDAEGFYLPLEFSEVLFAADEEIIPGGMVGSVPILLKECDRLAQILGIPDALTKDDDELWDAAEIQNEGKALWQLYGRESFVCVALREACRKSLETGAAVVFC